MRARIVEDLTRVAGAPVDVEFGLPPIDEAAPDNAVMDCIDSLDIDIDDYGPPNADHLAADCGMALAFFVTAGEQERLRRCEAPDCRRAFVDVSRNRSRRYCDSRTCGNRLHVAAYRARRKESAS